MNNDTIQSPFDGEPPERLLDDFHDQLLEFVNEFQPLMEKGRKLGISVYVGACSYDPLTNCCHREGLSAGDRNALLGMLVKDIRNAGG